MNASSLGIEIARAASCPAAYVGVRASTGLLQLAQQLSEALFGGIPFVGQGTGIRDEVPAVRLAADLLGAEVVVHGYGGEDGFCLEIEPLTPAREAVRALGAEPVTGDISAYLAGLISGLEGIKVIWVRSLEPGERSE